MTKHFKISILVFLFVANSGFSQQFGGHILGQNWQVLNSPSANIIYPFGLDSQAQRVANLVNFMSQNNRRSIGRDKRKISMVLHGQTVVPNGYVSLAPFRSEFFGTPPQSNLLIGSLGWLDVLTVHEYRHALQFMNSDHGTTSVAHILGGERLWGAVVGLIIPNWYFEGDAVITETALSKAGRGRSPFFTLEQRALAYSNSNYSYSKNRNGSYRDIVPNQYPLGYMMLSKARELKGNDITAKVFKESVKMDHIFSTFSKEMKTCVGYKTPKLYEIAWDSQKKKWLETLQNTTIIPTIDISETPKFVTDYHFPIILPDNSIIARKSSYQKIEALVQIKDGTEIELTKIGYNADDNLSYNAGILAWTELALNPRRSYQEFSDIVLYKINGGSPYHLTHQSRYFSPAVSPDGLLVAAIDIKPNLQNEIHILEISSGKIIKKIANPNNYVLSRIAWSTDGSEIISIAKQNNEIALIKCSTNENAITELSPWTSHTIESPKIAGNRVYFNASFSGIDNIYYTDLKGSKEIYQVSSVPIGAFEPSIDEKNNDLIFTEFTKMGYKISKQNLSETEPKIIDIVEPIDMPQFKTPAEVEEGGSILERNFDTKYTTKPYKGLLKGQRLHTWGPLLSSSSSTFFTGIQTSNFLNDVSFEAGIGSNFNERSFNNFTGTLKIARFYPEISLTAEKTDRNADFTNNRDGSSKINFNELAIGADISVPFNWLKTTFQHSFEPSLGFYSRKISNQKTKTRSYNDFNLNTFNIGFKFSKLQKIAQQNYGTRLGIKLNVNYLNSIDNKNEKINLNAKIYLPGFLQNHRILIKAAFQKEPLANQYQYLDEFEYSRGYGDVINNQFSLLSFNYGLPLVYPDAGIAGILYCKRIRTNLFFDAGFGKNTLFKENNFNSTGLELIFDNTYFNIIPLSLGLRASYLLNPNSSNLLGPIVPGVLIDLDF